MSWYMLFNLLCRPRYNTGPYPLSVQSIKQRSAPVISLLAGEIAGRAANKWLPGPLILLLSGPGGLFGLGPLGPGHQFCDHGVDIPPLVEHLVGGLGDGHLDARLLGQGAVSYTHLTLPTTPYV